jgi:hypothetical protein
LCFVLVLGSLVPCLPAFSSGSMTVKEDPIAADSVYAASQSKYLQTLGVSQLLERSHISCTHTFNPSTLEAEAGGSMSSRPAQST